MAIQVDTAEKLNISIQEICDFYKKNWQRKILLSNAKFCEWQFKESPTQNNENDTVVAYDTDDQEIAGLMGVNRRPFMMNSTQVNGGELTTWIVGDKWRGRGLGVRILKKLQDNFDILIGMGISAAALPLYMREGFRYIKQIPRFVKVVNFDAIKRYAEYDKSVPKLINKWNSLPEVPYFTSKVTPENIANINDRFLADHNSFKRDYLHLDWRYTDHPFFEYKQFLVSPTLGSKEDSVYVCLREENSLDDFKILHVLDCYGESKSIPSAVSFIEDYARKNNFDVIDFYCTTSSISCFFIAHGWFSIENDGCFQFPHLFHPVELRIPPTTSLTFWSRHDFAQFADINKLYITKQDADLDRPVEHSLSLIKKCG